MMMTFSSLAGGEMLESTGMPTTPQEQTHIFRWISPVAQDNLHVTALNPGQDKLDLQLRKIDDDNYAIDLKSIDGYMRTIELTADLQLKAE